MQDGWKWWQKLAQAFFTSQLGFLLFMAAGGALIAAVVWPFMWLFGWTADMGFGKWVGINALGWFCLTAMGYQKRSS